MDDKTVWLIYKNSQGKRQLKPFNTVVDARNWADNWEYEVIDIAISIKGVE